MLAYDLKRLADLTADQWRTWRSIQQSSSAYESPYFHPEFARAVAAVRDDAEVAVLRSGNETVGFFPFQRGALNLGKPLGGKLSDYHGPLVFPHVTFNPADWLSACRLASFDFDHLRCASAALDGCMTARARSPQIDLSAGYAAYLAERRAAGSQTLHRQARKTRNLERDIGPVRFAYDAADDEAFALLCEWKSAQYVRTGLADVFAFPWTLALIERLRSAPCANAFGVALSVLRAGDKVAAVSLSLRSEGVFHCWFVAYNPELHHYSPGLSFFNSLAEKAVGLGIRTIDLGRGDERYKQSLANASAEVGEGTLASRSLGTMLRAAWRHSRDWCARAPFPRGIRLSAKLITPLRHWVAYH